VSCSHVQKGRVHKFGVLLKTLFLSPISSIDVFSDGPTSQFKQRFLFSNLYYWEQAHEISIKWNFFATSHGKGVVDGIGGTVKRTVWRNVRCEKNHILNAKEYAELAKQLCPNIQIDFISKNLIDEQSGFLNAKWEGVLAVPGTHKVHCIQASGSDKVKVADISSEIGTSFRLSIFAKAPVYQLKMKRPKNFR